MKVDIYPKIIALKMIASGFPSNTAVVSFYTPINNDDRNKVDYSGVCTDVFYVAAPDIGLESLEDYGYTPDTFFAEVDALAEFIYEAKEKGYDIICQCEFGRSRSAACAAAIMEYFEKRGNDVFSNDKYNPNQLIYQKVLGALSKKDRKNNQG